MDAQETIDAKLVELERRSLKLLQDIRELKTQRNMHARISKVPNEVLLEIFMVMKPHAVRSWHQIAHVCRRWRNVAVGAPMLWTEPPTYNHDLTMLMLERSQEASLAIQLSSYTHHKTAQAVLRCIGRIESLDIDHEDDDDDDEDETPKDFFLQRVLLPALTQEATHLKSLKICWRSEQIWNCRAILELLPLYQLKGLDLATVRFEWSLLPLANLTHLSFRYVSLPAPISMQQFIETLRQMPLLESLRVPLSGNGSFPLTLSAPIKAKLILPRLCLLDLADSHPDHLLYFLAHTIFPRLRHLELRIKDPRGHTNFMNNYYSSAVQVIASTVANGNFGFFEGLELMPCSFKFFMCAERDNSARMRLDIPMDQREHSDVGKQVLLGLSELRQPNVSKLLRLEIGDWDIEGSLTEAEYLQLFRNLYQSTLQQFQTCTSKSIFTLTCVLSVPSHHPLGRTAIPFPNLKRIYVECVHFTDKPKVLDAFTDCLMWRRECGYPLHELVLSHCPGMAPTQIRRLKKAVINLDYDSSFPFYEVDEV